MIGWGLLKFAREANSFLLKEINEYVEYNFLTRLNFTAEKIGYFGNIAYVAVRSSLKLSSVKNYGG
ncbi:MAG: hypothetical protein G01um101472_312 [Parcubacteria group bacterium Gr01-1014_72]|nr:MAG: hypothetical protein G01um101472_312 [Parcubacteria group bacterium Gr01-1014_72]